MMKKMVKRKFRRLQNVSLGMSAWVCVCMYVCMYMCVIGWKQWPQLFYFLTIDLSTLKQATHIYLAPVLTLCSLSFCSHCPFPRGLLVVCIFIYKAL